MVQCGMTSRQKDDNLVWIDLEMTGLDPKKCTVLEIGVLVTDNELNVIEEGPEIAIHHSEKTLEGMEAWSKHHHRKSGLTQACRESKISMKKAEEKALKFIRSHCHIKTAPLCGNTIWQDRRFLVKYMPTLESYLHYRTIDVSTLKELGQRWFPGKYKMPREKNQTHRVMNDIRESVEELRFYRDKLFIKREE